MPAILTHDFFGKDAYGPAMDYVDLVTPDERDAFLLGNQGPDPFFYLSVVPRASWDAYKSLGSVMHHDAPSSVMLAMRRALDSTPFEDRPVAAAYVAGFVCHYLLDSSVHPLVYFWQDGITGAGVEGLDASDGSIVHAEIERDLDEAVLWNKLHQTVETYRPYEQVLQARNSVLDTVGRLFAASGISVLADDPEASARVFPEAVRCFRVTQRAFYLPGKARTFVIAGAERLYLRGHYSLYQAMSHRVRKASTSAFDNHEHLGWRNPFTGEVSSESFRDIYADALARVPGALGTFLSESFDEDAAHALTGGLNFSGEPTD